MSDESNGAPDAHAEGDEVTQLDEEGGEHRFTLHDAFDADGLTYYLVEAVADPDQVLLLKETGSALEAVGGEELERVMVALELQETDADEPDDISKTGGQEAT